MEIIKITLLVLAGLLLLLGVAAACYVYNNLNYDKGTAKKLQKAGFTEKQATLPDGTVLNYGEGPENGPPLLLIHGQMTSWENYVRVLPKLSKHYHIFAVDCHGHGKSSKDPAKYTAQAMGKDFIWFIDEVIGQPAIVSGHSSAATQRLVGKRMPEKVLGIVLEDPPFFSTEPDRSGKTFAGLGFEVIHRFLNQTEETNYTRFFLEHTYLQTFFGEGWNGIKNYAFKYMEKNPGKPLRIFFLPPLVNQAFDLTAVLRSAFWRTFYDHSWFDGFDKQKPWRGSNALPYYSYSWSYRRRDSSGSHSGEDAQRAHQLIAGNKLIEVKSGHGFHFEKPKEFIRIMLAFLEDLKTQGFFSLSQLTL